MERKRYDVIARGPTTLSSHDDVREAAEVAKKVAFETSDIVEVWDHEEERTVFRAKSGESHWHTRRAIVTEKKP